MVRHVVAVTGSAVCVFAWTLGVSSQNAGAGPFGLRKGLPLIDAEKIAGPLTPRQPGIYSTARVPQPHPVFESYGLVITPDAGLCAILATGKTRDIGPTGARIRLDFDALRRTLAESYGAPSRVDDALTPGSTLGTPADWAMALARQQRTLAAIWNLKPNQSGLSDIALVAFGLSSSKAYVRLSFGFSNTAGCFDEVKRMRRR